MLQIHRSRMPRYRLSTGNAAWWVGASPAQAVLAGAGNESTCGPCSPSATAQGPPEEACWTSTRRRASLTPWTSRRRLTHCAGPAASERRVRRRLRAREAAQGPAGDGSLPHSARRLARAGRERADPRRGGLHGKTPRRRGRPAARERSARADQPHPPIPPRSSSSRQTPTASTRSRHDEPNGDGEPTPAGRNDVARCDGTIRTPRRRSSAGRAPLL